MSRFACDAMLGGLARRLRALGHEASFVHGIEDGALVELARATDAVLLSSDAPLFERRPVKSGEVRALFVPRHADVADQAVFVLLTLGLSVEDVRCMRCGGALEPVERASVSAEVPPRAFAAFDRFYRCAGCRGVYWHGTHWTRIEASRTAIAERLALARGAP